MGQAMSYPPLDVVIDVAKFLWFEDIHTATTVSRTVKDMMETETDLWRCLLSSVVNRVLSVPYGLHLERTDTIITKLLFQRFCDFPTSVDSIIFGKYKGPKNVSIEDISVGSNLTVNFQRPITASSLLHEVPTRRTIVASNSFPYLMGSTKVPRALVPFTKIMMSSCPAKRVAKRMRVQSVHIASLSSVAYFECTMCKSPLATCEVQQIDGQNHSKSIFRIGVACSPFIIRTSLPGDDSFSFGYDSSTGHVVQSHLPCGPPTEPYGAGDTVGCGIVYPLTPQDDGCIFFTKNGRLQQKVVLSNFFSICWFPVMVRLSFTVFDVVIAMSIHPFLLYMVFIVCLFVHFF